MDRYLADRPDQIVSTAIRCLTNLSKDDMFTESTSALGESAKNEEPDPSLKEKIIRAIDKTADAIENHGKSVKDNAKDTTKRIKSRRDLPDTKVKIRDMKRVNTISKNTQKEIKRAYANGEDKSALDKIMAAYHEHRKAVLATAAVSIVAIPALISGIIDGFNDTVDNAVVDTKEFAKEVANDIKNNKTDPKTASAYGAAYSTVSKDTISDAAKSYSGAIDAVRETMGG